MTLNERADRYYSAMVKAERDSGSRLLEHKAKAAAALADEEIESYKTENARLRQIIDRVYAAIDETAGTEHP